MRRDPLFEATLNDRHERSGPPPWRLESLYLLAFFGGGAAAALISFFNARRLGMATKASYQMLALGAGFLVVSGFALAVAAIYGSSLPSEAAESDFQEKLRSYGLLVRLCSLGVAWLLIRIQVREFRLYQIEAGGDAGYSSLWLPGFFAALGSTALHFMLPMLGVISHEAGLWKIG